MKQLEHSFEAWSFTEEEIPLVRHISEEHRRYLKTILADAAEEKLRIPFDPYKPLLFAQHEAYLRGQMDILAMLISDSDLARPKLVAAAEDASTQPGKD